MLREHPEGTVGGTLELLGLSLHGDHYSPALGDLVGPQASTVVLVVGQAGGTLIPVGLAVQALPEDGAAFQVGEGTVEAGAVLS